MEYIKFPDMAFLPKNLPYTMSDEEFLTASNTVRTKTLFPYPYFEIDAKTILR